MNGESNSVDGSGKKLTFALLVFLILVIIIIAIGTGRLDARLKEMESQALSLGYGEYRNGEFVFKNNGK